jgi:hypothetical protein
MTMNETLFFLSGLHDFLEQGCAKKGKCCWPTLEQVHLNLRVNRESFPRDQQVYNSFQRQFKIALTRHWAAVEACGPDCHSKHLWLTPVGRGMLAQMNEHGCARCSQHGALTALQFEREAA